MSMMFEYGRIADITELQPYMKFFFSCFVSVRITAQSPSSPELTHHDIKAERHMTVLISVVGAIKYSVLLKSRGCISMDNLPRGGREKLLETGAERYSATPRLHMEKGFASSFGIFPSSIQRPHNYKANKFCSLRLTPEQVSRRSRTLRIYRHLRAIIISRSASSCAIHHGRLRHPPTSHRAAGPRRGSSDCVYAVQRRRQATVE